MTARSVPLSLFDEEIDRREVPALKVHPNIVGADLENLFAAGVADMDFRAPEPVLKAMADRTAHGVFGYEAVPAALIPTLCNWLAVRHSWTVEQEHVLRSPNVLNALAMAANLFTEPGDGIIVQPPVFFDFFDILQENGRKLVENPLVLQGSQYCMDFADLEQKAADPRTRMIYLCNPHNPVGRVWNAEELLQLGEICARHNVLVVSDEMHGDLVLPGHTYVPFASLSTECAENSITCLSPAKSFNIAACCSAFTVISNDEMRAEFQRENSRLTVNKNNAFANVAMLAAYEHGGPWLDSLLVYLEQNVSLLREHLGGIPGVELIEPEGTFLAWVDFRELGLGPDELTGFLKETARWAVSRGPAFGSQGTGFARVNFACPHHKLEQALERLADAVHRL